MSALFQSNWLLQGCSFCDKWSVRSTIADTPSGAYRFDVLVEGSVLVEVKSVDKFERVFLAQVLTYLRATECRLGLIINFNVPVLKEGIKRVAL